MALFLSAGRVDWWPGWALIAVMLAWITATILFILRTNPDLLAERLGPRIGAKGWNTGIMGIVGIATLTRLIVAGLDQHYGWTGSISLYAQIAALTYSALVAGNTTQCQTRQNEFPPPI